MIVAVADTHVTIWYLFGDARLSRKARDFIDAPAGTDANVAVSAITLAEVIYLSEKGRLPATTFNRLNAAIHAPGGVFVEVPVDSSIIEHMPKVTREQVPDLPDRLIAATALHLKVPVLARNRPHQTRGAGGPSK